MGCLKLIDTGEKTAALKVVYRIGCQGVLEEQAEKRKAVKLGVAYRDANKGGGEKPFSLTKEQQLKMGLTNYGGDYSGSMYDKLLGAMYAINQINPFAIAADIISGITSGTDRMGNPQSGFETDFKFATVLLPLKGVKFGSISLASGEAAFNSNLIGGKSFLFGRAKLGSFGGEANGVLNRGYLRLGWSWDNSASSHLFQPRAGSTYGATHYKPWFTYKP